MHDAMGCAVPREIGMGNGFVSPKSISDVQLYVYAFESDPLYANDLHTFLWG